MADGAHGGGDVHGRGCAWQGACVAGGHAWQGACMVGGGGMCGVGCVWHTVNERAVRILLAMHSCYVHSDMTCDDNYKKTMPDLPTLYSDGKPRLQTSVHTCQKLHVNSRETQLKRFPLLSIETSPLTQ